MLLYHLVKTYIKTGLFLFYKKTTVLGKENIPEKGPILFVANHQNAMMDPLVVATSTKKTMYFLARASAFKNKIAAKLLTAIHAIAIYRVRDGVNSKELNEAVFSHCNDLLNQHKNILIFPEGSHHIVRKVRSLRAGFTRITFDFLNENKEANLVIIPIGLNYSNTINYAKSLTIIYGKPIYTRQFYNETNLEKSTDNLIKEVHQKLSALTVHIEDSENYNTILNHLNETELLTPQQTNEKIKKINFTENLKKKKATKIKNVFYYIMVLNSIFPFLIWKWLQPKIDAIEFVSTAKYALGLTIFPLFYFIQTILIYIFFGGTFAMLYILLCFLLIILSTKTR